MFSSGISRQARRRLLFACVIAMLVARDPSIGAAGNNALRFDGVNDYVTFGNPAALGLKTFTLEVWLRRAGAGVTTSTGTGGVNAAPLVAKGRAEADGSTRDMNYFLGIDGSGHLVADFEEGAAGASPGLNHPITGATVLATNTWYHAAATYDGSTWRLYVNGVADGVLAVGRPVRFDSIQRASIASAQDSAGTAAGFFNGTIDEVRIWNVVRSASAIQAAMNSPITSASGLVARWSLDEGTGTTIGDSSGSSATGAARNGPVWVTGAPALTSTTNQPPVANAGPDTTITLPSTASLIGQVTDDVPASISSTWTKVSGAGTVTFANAGLPATTATFSTAGTYVLRLTATDGQFTASDEVTIQVNAAVPVNQPPVVNAGPDGAVTLPAALTLNGSATDDNLPGGPVTFTWSQTSGPGVVTFGSAASAATSATFSLPGTYVLRLTASDGALSAADTLTAIVTAAAGSNTALRFPGAGAYVTFGPAPALGSAVFTIEAWFRQRGAGQATSTGTGGVTAVPLVSKGRSESDGSNKDMNYFFGLDASSHLVADFEEGAGGASPGLNHPVVGSTPVVNDTWYHAAATYDGSTWRLYLNGVLDGQLVVNRPPRADSIQHAAIATAMNSTGAAAGFFNGDIDEVRVWNVARTEQQIAGSMNTSIVSAAGLVGRWGLNEGAGTAAADSSGKGVQGTIVGTGWSWVAGAPFSANLPPDAPTLVGPVNGATGVGTSPALQVLVSDSEQDNLTVSFFGRAVPAASPDFTLVAIPDTQHYVDSSFYQTFTAQTQWIVNNRAALNVAFVTQLGDLTQNIDAVQQEWIRADTSMRVLDLAGVPYNVSPGNHDISTAGVAMFYDQYFPVARFLPQPSYGGWLGKEAGEINRENKDNYELFSVGTLDFLVIHLEMDIPDYSLAWADKILKRYPNRRAIISTHIYLDITGTRRTSPQFRSNGTSAEQVWQQLVKPNCNVFMVVNGHYHGEARRTDLNNCGQPVHQIVQDYQDDPNGGDGWLRYFTFKPAENRIYAYTYSPTRNGGLGEYDTDAASQFVLDYAMQGTPFVALGSVSRVGSGPAAVNWTGRAPGTTYEWYVTVSDGHTTTVGPTWRFATQ